MRAKRVAIGDNYIDQANYTWEELNGDGGEVDYNADLVVEGNVGIGTTNPNAKLHVNSATTGQIFFSTDTALASTNMGLWFLPDYDDNPWGTFTGIGMYHDGSLRFATGGADQSVPKMIITPTGNVGIGLGTADPVRKLDVAGDLGIGNFIYTNSSNTGGYIGLLTSASAAQGLKVGGLAITSSYGNSYPTNGLYVEGNVGIGTAPSYKLDVYGNGTWAGTGGIRLRGSNPGIQIVDIVSGQDWLMSNGCNSGNDGYWCLFDVNRSRRNIVVNPNGAVGIFQANPSYTLHVNGTFYYSGSSIRYKENVRPLEVDVSKIYLLNPVSFDFKNDYKNFGKKLAGGRQIGLIAEDVAKVVPELAVMLNGQVSNVDYEKLSVLLLQAIKDLKAQNDSLRSSQSKLESRIQALEARR